MRKTQSQKQRQAKEEMDMLWKNILVMLIRNDGTISTRDIIQAGMKYKGKNIWSKEARDIAVQLENMGKVKLHEGIRGAYTITLL